MRRGGSLSMTNGDDGAERGTESEMLSRVGSEWRL